MTGIEASNKVYAGTNSATLIVTNAALAGAISPDDVNLSTTNAAGAFADKNVGPGKSVSVTGLELYGADAANYTITEPTTNATITALPVTVTAATDAKTYDGSNSSTGSPTITSGRLVDGDTATGWTQTFDSRNVGSRTLTPAGVVNDGNGGNNYNVTYATAAGSISVRAITVAAAADTKPYDGSTSSAGTPTVTSGTAATGDAAPAWTQSFDSRNAGSRTLTPAGTMLDANGGNNYDVTYATASGSISARSLTVTAITDANPYDGTATSTGTPTITSGTVVSGDAAPAWTQSFDSPNAGARTLTPAGTVLDGNGGNNYDVTYATASGSISAAGSTTSLISSVNPSGPGSNVMFTATVSSGVGTPAGDVVFLANSVPFRTNTLASGSVSASTADLPLGTNTITAQFDAQGNYAASSFSIDQVVKLLVVYSQTNVILSLVDIGSGAFTLNCQGTPDAQYYIVASPDITAPMSAWSPLVDSTNTVVGPAGLWSFTVSNAAPAFYRSVAVNPAP